MPYRGLLGLACGCATVVGAGAFSSPWLFALTSKLAAIGAEVLAPYPPASTTTAKAIRGLSTGANPMNQESIRCSRWMCALPRELQAACKPTRSEEHTSEL